MGLQLHVCVSAGMVHEDTSSLVLGIAVLLSIGIQQTSKRVADEVVDRDLLTGEQVVPLQDANFRLDGFLDAFRHRSAPLLGILTGSAQRSMSEL